MSLTPVAGSVRLKAIQMGIESTFKTAVAATRRYPWTFNPDVNPNLTFTTGDTGTLDQAVAPYQTTFDIVAAASGELYSDDVPTLLSAGVMGGVSLTGGGSAKTFTAAPASTSQDVFDTWTAETGDDATGDTWQLAGGVINDFTLTYPQGDGPITFASNWRFAKATYAATPTSSLSVDTNPVPLFTKDTEFYVNDSSGTIETTKLTDIAYSAEFSVNNNLDLKRWANGSNTRNQIQNYGRGERVVTFNLVGAKQTAWLTEVSNWIAANPTERFWGVKTTSPTIITGSTPHSLDIRLAGYWMTYSRQDITANTAIQLSGRGVYDSNLGYPFRISSVSARATL